jgi:hypothetical protein
VLTCLSFIAMGTKRCWSELDGNKGNLDGNCSGTWWEQKDIDGLLMGTRGIWWEFFGNMMRTKGFWWEQEELVGTCLGTWWEINSQPLQKDKKHLAFFFLLAKFCQKVKFSSKNLKLKWLWRFSIAKIEKKIK